jgi:hypothetical protein
LAADEEGFSRIAHGQYVIFIALQRELEREPSFKQQKVSKSLLKLFKTKRNKPKIKRGATAVVNLKNFLHTFLLAKVKITR